MKKYAALFFMFITSVMALAQQNFTEKELVVDQFTEGTLSLPENETNTPLVIFIQGSGPTNRDGNQPMMKNDGIKKIAHQLAENGIASYRFDKRIFKMDKFKIKEEDLRFEDFVTDVKNIITYFRQNTDFETIILAGHSEGSLIGMLAAPQAADAFISLAGPGSPIDEIVVAQILKQSEELSENARRAFDELRLKGKADDYSPYLESVFRPSVQPYMRSWMQYDPAEEIARLEIPVLLINGSFDLQVETEDAEILKEAHPQARLVVLEDMNHIFRKINSGDSLENTKAYNEPGRPLHPELIPALTEFIKNIQEIK